jgi:hypothetical protein
MSFDIPLETSQPDGPVPGKLSQVLPQGDLRLSPRLSPRERELPKSTRKVSGGKFIPRTVNLDAEIESHEGLELSPYK